MTLTLANAKLVPAGGGLAAGALFGAMFGGLPGALIGAGVGGVGGYFFGRKLEDEAHALLSHFHPAAMQGAPTVAQNVYDSGAAKPAATSLYAYLRAHGADGSASLAQLVTAFQTAHDADPNAVQLTGPLPTSGVFDVKTSAALVLYTHDAIPAATPPAPQPAPTPAQVADVYLPGAAATSGYALYMGLKRNGTAPTSALNRLVHQFQIDVNADPKFPGPSGVVGQGILKILVKSPLPVTGIYDAATAAALTILTNDAIKP